MAKPNSIDQIIGTWRERQWNNEIVFSIHKLESNKIAMTHLINNAVINPIAEFNFSFDAHSQIILQSEIDRYIAWNVDGNFIQIDKDLGRETYRFNLTKTP